jgi:tRNA A37 threonylcarbamoyladenosine synthetase subunit TsaC/SUA5/YrdC
MVRCKSNTRFSSIKNKVILTQTDTTVGFVSQNHEKLANIKSRPQSKPFIKIYNSFKHIQSRIPQNKKALVRRAKKTTFVVKNRAFRVDNSFKNSELLRELNWHYSTSANENAKSFCREFCEEKADIIIEDQKGLNELSSSRLLKINNTKIKALR